MEAQVFVDLDHAVNLVVPVVPQGFRASYERAAPRKEGILITAEASSSRSKNKVSHTLSTIFVVLNWMFDNLTTVHLYDQDSQLEDSFFLDSHLLDASILHYCCNLILKIDDIQCMIN